MSDVDFEKLAAVLDPQKAAAAMQLDKFAKELPDGRVEVTFKYPFDQPEDEGDGDKPVTYQNVVLSRPKGKHMKMIAKAGSTPDDDVLERIILELSPLSPTSLADRIDAVDYARLLAAFNLFFPKPPQESGAALAK